MCTSCDWETRVERIDELLDDDEYLFAVDTLEDIREWIVKNEHATEGQVTAIEDVANAKGDSR